MRKKHESPVVSINDLECKKLSHGEKFSSERQRLGPAFGYAFGPAFGPVFEYAETAPSGAGSEHQLINDSKKEPSS